MTVIQPTLVNGVVNYINQQIDGGKVRINGELVDRVITSTILEGNTIRKYILLDEDVGFVEEAQLVSTSGEVLAKKAFSINLTEDGTALAFEIKVVVQEG